MNGSASFGFSGIGKCVPGWIEMFPRALGLSAFEMKAMALQSGYQCGREWAQKFLTDIYESDLKNTGNFSEDPINGHTGIHVEPKVERIKKAFLYALDINLPRPYERRGIVTIGDKIWQTRMKQGLKQSELAKVLGVCKESISRWERISFPSAPKRLERVNKALVTHQL